MQRILSLVLLMSALVFLPFSSHAEDPAGQTIILELSGDNAIWDLSGQDWGGTEHACEIDPDLGEICFDVITTFPLVVDAKGRIEGTGNITFTATLNSEPILNGSLSGMLKGKVKGKNGQANFKGKFKSKGGITATFPGVPQTNLPFKASLKFEGDTDQNGDYTSNASGKICIKKFGCEKIQSDPVTGNAGDGSWTLTLGIAGESKDKLGGTATADTALALIPFVIKGKYNDGKDKSKLKLKPVPTYKGAKISLKGLQVIGGSAVDGELKYQLMGMKGQATIP